MAPSDPTDPRHDGHGDDPAESGCEAGDLRGTLQHIVGQIGDADRRHSDALAAMQERLAQLSIYAENARAARPAAAPRVDRTVMRPAETFAAWDSEAADALTRLYETDDGDPRRWPHGTPRPRRPWSPPAAAVPPPQPDAARDNRWLEARISGVAADLQAAMAAFDPSKPLAAIDARLEQMEARFGAALDDVARRCDVEGLRLVEAHILELAAHVDRANGQLARLDTIDGQLTELAAHVDRASGNAARFDAIDSRLADLADRLDGQRDLPDAGPVRLSDGAIESLIDNAAERAAARVADGMPAPSPIDRQGAKRLDALETLLKDYITDRRRSEEQATATLASLEDALVRIADRVDSIEAAKPAGAPSFRQEEDEMAEVYAAGARAMGARGVAATLSAADYLPPAIQREPLVAPPPLLRHQQIEHEPVLHEPVLHEPGLREPVLREPVLPEPAPRPLAARAEPPVLAEIGISPEPRPSSIRARLRAQSGTGAVAADLDPESVLPSKAAQSGGGPRPTFLIAAIAALLFGAGYLVVDAFLSRPISPRVPQAILQPKKELLPPPADVEPVRAMPRSVDTPAPPAAAEADKPAAAPPAAAPAPDDKYDTLLPGSVPRPRRVPETVTDDLSQNEAPREGARFRALAGAMASAFAAMPVAVPSGEGVGVHAGLGDTAPSTLVPLAIGPAPLRHAALKGDPAAECEIAARYAEGRGVPQDVKQAFGWYQRAAMRGYAPAQYSLGRIFERGVGVSADMGRAKVWYARAAEQGHVRAMHNLAVLSAGDRMSADHVAAARWFKQAAERGLTDSQYNLAVLYQTGRGVEKDPAQAYKWFALAARSGDTEAASRLAEVKAQLAPARLQSLEAEIAAWRPSVSETAAASGALN